MQFLVPLILAFSSLFPFSSQKPRSVTDHVIVGYDVRRRSSSSSRLPAPAPSKGAAAADEGAGRRSKRQVVWDYRTCQKLAVLIEKKSLAINRIEKRIADLEPDSEADPHLRPMSHLQADSLRILVQELDETEKMIWQSIRWLEDVLSGGDYSSVLSLTGNAWKRLDALRHATLREEEEYIALVKAEVSMCYMDRAKIVLKITDTTLRCYCLFHCDNDDDDDDDDDDANNAAAISEVFNF